MGGTTRVQSNQRFSRNYPCPICGGHEGQARGKKLRCHGFLSDDGAYAHCTRDEHAGDLSLNSNSGTYAHRLRGDCGCGRSHNPGVESERNGWSNSRGDRQLVAIYPYQDEQGVLLYQVLRHEPKSFSQRRPDGRGGYTWNLNGVRRVLYRLLELNAAAPDAMVFVAEGEKDADALAGLGCVATTNPGGAKKWRSEFNEALRGRRAVILPDNDADGRAHAQQVAQNLQGVAAEVRIVRLPDLPPKGDVSDWIAAGGTREELERLAAEQPPDSEASDSNTGDSQRSESCFIPLEQLLAEPESEVQWLVDGLLPMGGISLDAAKPKTGKSTFARNLAAAVAQGTPFLGRTTVAGPVLYLCLEERRDDVRRAFRALGVPPTAPIYFCDTLPPATDPIAWINSEIRRLGAVLVIVDTIGRLIGVKDLNDYAQVTKATGPLLRIARDTGAHVHLAHHAKKGNAKSEAVDAPLGSTALAGLVDTIIVLKRHQDGTRTIETRQRTGSDMPETLVVMNATTGALSLGAGWDKSRRAEVETAIEQALRDHGPLNNDQLREGVQGDRRMLAEVLAAMRKAKRVITTGGTGKKGDPFLFGLAGDTSQQESGQSREADKRGDANSSPMGSSLLTSFPAAATKTPVSRVNARAGGPAELTSAPSCPIPASLLSCFPTGGDEGSVTDTVTGGADSQLADEQPPDVDAAHSQARERACASVQTQDAGGVPRSPAKREPGEEG